MSKIERSEPENIGMHRRTPRPSFRGRLTLAILAATLLASSALAADGGDMPLDLIGDPMALSTASGLGLAGSIRGTPSDHGNIQFAPSVMALQESYDAQIAGFVFPESQKGFHRKRYFHPIRNWAGSCLNGVLVATISDGVCRGHAPSIVCTEKNWSSWSGSRGGEQKSWLMFLCILKQTVSLSRRNPLFMEVPAPIR